MRLKKSRKWLLFIGLFSALIVYCTYNFKEQKRQLGRVIAPSSSGNVKQTLENLDAVKGFSNPIVHLIYKFYLKRKYNNRFIKNEKESISDNTILNEIATIYKEYWKIKLLKKETISQADSLLQRNLHTYFKNEKLTELSFKEYNLDELTRIINAQGAKVEFFYLNEIYGLVIWDEQSVNEYTIELPSDTITINVINIENYLLHDWLNFATVGDSKTGGWVNKHTAKIYCNKGAYNFSSEKFLISYLKHEGLHFVDLKKYTNLSSADLEYRSKLLELSNLDSYLFDRLEEFTLFANSTNRALSHPYANYAVIRDLSKVIFNSGFENDMDKWKEVSKEKINVASLKLLEQNTQILEKNPMIDKLID